MQVSVISFKNDARLANHSLSTIKLPVRRAQPNIGRPSPPRERSDSFLRTQKFDFNEIESDEDRLGG